MQSQPQWLPLNGTAGTRVTIFRLLTFGRFVRGFAIDPTTAPDDMQRVTAGCTD